MDIASELMPITGLEKKLELVPMYALVKEMTAEGVCVPFEKEPLRIQKWGKEKSKLNTNEMALQRACVIKLTKSGFVASKFERAAKLLVTADYARKHEDLVLRALEEVKERKEFIRKRNEPCKVSMALNIKTKLITEVVKRWCNGWLPAPIIEWNTYLEKVYQDNQKRAALGRIEMGQELNEYKETEKLTFAMDDRAFEQEAVVPVVELMVHKVQLEKLKLFYVKWIHNNGGKPEEDFKKLKVPISQWLTLEKIKK